MSAPKLFYDNRFADATPVASTTAAGSYAAANLNDLRPYTWWKPTALPATVTVDCGSAKAADFALFYGHDLHTQGASIEIHGSTDNFAASDVTVVASYAPTSDDPFLLEFASASYRYWRLKITGTTMPSIAMVLIGAELVMPEYLNNGFDPLARNVIGRSNNNDNGQPLGAIVDYEQWKQTLEFDFVSWSWLRSTWQPAWRNYLRSSPFIFAWDSVDYPAELYLVRAGNSYQTPHTNGLLANLIFDVSGVGT